MADQQNQPATAAAPQHISLEPTSRLDAVPDSLIALAKDARYVKEVQALFQQVLSFWWPRRRLVEQESWILASLLCLALGLKQTAHGTTLGMETLGLKFSVNAKRWKLVLGVLGTLGWAYAFSPQRSSDSATNSGSHHSDERLRGLSRREFHERQRQAMLRRAEEAASRASSNATTSMAASVDADSASRTNSFSMQDLRQKINQILLKFSRILASAILSPFEGPHTLPADTNQQQQQQQQQQNGIASAGRWLVKLQLAHFCLTGMYPTFMHRLTGHALETISSTRLYHRPDTARLVGLLLGAQLVSALVQASSTAVSQWLVQRQSSSQPETSAPAVAFESDNSQQSDASTNSSICSICKMERNHPAAPESCGHVFCWKCLVQWVSTIRPECPLCRKTCRPQDIVALHNYEAAR